MYKYSYSSSFQLEKLRVIIIKPCSKISFLARIIVAGNAERFPKISGDNSRHFWVFRETHFGTRKKAPEMFSGPKSSPDFRKTHARTEQP